MEGESVEGVQKRENNTQIDQGERGKGPELMSEKKLVIIGLEHTRKMEDLQGILPKLEDFSNGNVENKCVLIEGVEPLMKAKEEFAKDPNQKMEDLLPRYGEQAAIAYMFLKHSIKVESWDMSFEEQLETARQKFGSEYTSIWFLSQAFIHLKRNNLPLTVDSAINFLHEQIGIDGEKLLELLGLNSWQDLDGLIRNKLGYGLEKLSSDEGTYKRFTRLADPTMTEEEIKSLSPSEQAVAKIPRSMGELRDSLAIDKVSRSLSGYSDVLVICGRIHAEEWRKSGKLPNVNLAIN